MAPDVIAIIVNYGTADLTLQAVESLLAQPARLAHIHVVDNASPPLDGPPLDGTADAQLLGRAIAERGWGGQVTLWAEPVNHGFGRGNNLVIDQVLAGVLAGSSADKIFLLNPDARVLGDAVARLADFLDHNPGVGAVGAAILKPDDQGTPRPVTAAFRFPSPVSTFAEAVSFGPLARALARHAVALPPDQPSGPVDWVAGAAVMLRARALAEVGAFDPDFFLYYEEVELMHRLARAGWQTWYLTTAQVIHAEGAATGVKSADLRRRRPGYWYRSWGLYMVKTHGRLWACAALGLWLAGAGVNGAISLVRRRPPAAPLRFYRDVLTHALPVLLSPTGGRDGAL